MDKSIKFLESYEDMYDTALIYMSDHGESLGEGGLYLHGMPYFIAPDAQKKLHLLYGLEMVLDHMKRFYL